jgi:hypothetical protein
MGMKCRILTAATAIATATVTTAIGRSAAAHAAARATTNVTTSRRTATTAATTSSTATAAEAGALTRNVLQKAGKFLVSLFEQFDQVSNNASIATVEEGGGETSVTGTTSTTDTMDIVVNVGWEIVVDNVGDIAGQMLASSQ